MEDLVIPETNDFGTLFDAEAFLDEDNDLRLKLTYLDKEGNHTTITTGKIHYSSLEVEYCGFEKEARVEISIVPDKLGNLFIMETYK